MSVSTIKLHDLEAIRALRAVRYRIAAGPECPKCCGTDTVGLEDGPDFACRDCGHNWLDGESEREYRREPELNTER